MSLHPLWKEVCCTSTSRSALCMPEVSWQQPECPILAMHITVLSFRASDPGINCLILSFSSENKISVVYSSLLPCDVHGLSVSTRAGGGTAQDGWGTCTAPTCQHSSRAQGLRYTGSAKVPGLFEFLPKATCAGGNLLCRTMPDPLVQGRAL